MLKKVIVVLAKMVKILSMFALSIGLSGFILVLMLTVYEVSTHVHRGFLEISNGDRSFLLFSFCITAFIFLLGTTSFFKSLRIINNLNL
jgi:hypothetical protein